MPQVEKGFGEYIKGQDKMFEDYSTKNISNQTSGLAREEWNKQIGKTLDKSGFASAMGTEGFKPSMLNISKDIYSSENPAIKQLMESFKGISDGTLKGGMDEMQSAIMLPMLIQQLLGE
jgi:hypothetical protein